MKVKFTLLIAFLVFVSTFTFAGENPKSNGAKTVLLTGVVTDPSNQENLAGVKIKCNTCEKTIYSDINGRFMLLVEINPNENLNIEFSQIGYTSKNLYLQDLSSNSGNIEVNLISE